MSSEAPDGRAPRGNGASDPTGGFRGSGAPDGRAPRRGSPIRALTLDAMGCLVTMRDPVPAIARMLEDRGTPRPADAIAVALRREIAFYKAHHLEARDAARLRTVQVRAAGVLAEALGVTFDGGSDPDDAFVDAFLATLEFVPLAGVDAALARLDAAGVPMVCVSNWDVDLPAHLERLGLARHLHGVVTSGAVGVAKPDPRIFDVAVDLLDVPRDAIGHVGDEPVDRAGALAAGLRFLPAPVETLPERLGLA